MTLARRRLHQRTDRIEDYPELGVVLLFEGIELEGKILVELFRANDEGRTICYWTRRLSYHSRRETPCSVKARKYVRM
jgi:hypothetical protein